jgi:hypothetical protein
LVRCNGARGESVVSPPGIHVIVKGPSRHVRRAGEDPV